MESEGGAKVEIKKEANDEEYEEEEITSKKEMVTEMESNSEAQVEVKKEEGTVKVEVKKEPEETPKKQENKKSRAEANDTSGTNLFRVKVSGLPRFYSTNDPLLTEFKKMLRDELNLKFLYIRSPKKGNSWLYITFLTLEDQMKALNTLKRYTWKGRTIIGTLVVADLRKRKTDDQSNGTLESKKAKYDIPIEEQMLMSTIPYHSVSYDEQLSKKNEETVSLLKWLTLLIEKRNHLLSGYFDKQSADNKNSLPLVLDNVRPSPLIDGYRNKCEFRIGRNRETGALTVGYRVDNQEDGVLDVAPPDSLRHLPRQMIDIVKVFEKFVAQWEDPSNAANNAQASLKLLTVRINKTEQMMLVITALLTDQPTTEDSEGAKAEGADVKVQLPDSIRHLKQAIIQFFSKGEGSSSNVVSLFLFVEKDKQVGEHKKVVPIDEDHIWGSKYLEEEVLGLKLEVTPEFYFQCNTHSAEVLYQAVAELAEVSDETTVLDLCCGSGGMGMVLAKQAKEVIGVELMDANVEGAKRLSLKNGLENCEFVQGKIDDVYPSLLEKLKDKKVVSILDPPRAGISPNMIINLRKLTEADRLIYVCSNHKLPLKNLLDLATVEESSFGETNPFLPTRVIPIDVSPHTLRCELVILCERVDMKELPKPTREPKKAPQSSFHRNKRRYQGGGQSWRGKVGWNRNWSKPARNNNMGGGGGYNRGRGGGKGGKPAVNQKGGGKGLVGKGGKAQQPPPLMGTFYPKPKMASFGPPPMSARDSLYPPPLRDALYNMSPRGGNYRSGGPFGGGGNNDSDFMNRRGPGGFGNSGRFSGRDNSYDNYEPNNYYGSAFEPYDYETRYSNFRRDVEDAINSSYPSWGNQNQQMRNQSGRNQSGRQNRSGGGGGNRSGRGGGTWR